MHGIVQNLDDFKEHIYNIIADCEVAVMGWYLHIGYISPLVNEQA